jgi:predicted Zn-dependent protease
MKRILGIGLCTLALTVAAATASAIGLGSIGGAVKDTVDVVKTMSMGTKEEMEIGSQVHPQILAEMGGEYRSKAVGDYVNRVGQKLAAKSTRKGINYRFTVVNSTMVNAFALPGGYVYVTRGILSAMKDEAELAAVLGHEIGHVEAKHGVERMQKIMLAEKGTKYAAKGGGKAGGALGEKALGELTKMFSKIAISGYGRKQELESDRIGIRLANANGYDPNGAVRLFQTLLKLEGGKSKGGLYASHPETKKRIEQAEGEIAKISPKGKATNKPQYLAIQKKV